MTRTRRIADRFAGFILVGVVLCSLIDALLAAPPQRYDDLLAQAKQNATAVDFTALRYAYAESAQYNPYDPNDAELNKSIVNAMNARDCTSAMKHAQAILEKKLRPYQCTRRLGDLLPATQRGPGGGAP
jgi:DNA repair ATPase RecN